MPEGNNFDALRAHALNGGNSQSSDGRLRPSSSRSSIVRDFSKFCPFPTPGLKEQKYFADYKSVEEQRLEEERNKIRHWKRWGPYLSERQWATVREDYSANGDAWTHFPHEHARSRAYRWGEDGLGGISDNHGRLALSFALWNEKDPILKERLFGVTGHQGNHGEDVKELYYYLDSSPTHSYMKFLYKYPQSRFPYEKLVRESTNRSRDVVEFEILDTDAFDDNKYWDVFVEYAKDEENENGISLRIAAYNRGPEPATLHIVPQVWFRNTWSWPKERPQGDKMPKLSESTSQSGSESSPYTVDIDHSGLGERFYLYANPSPAPAGAPDRSSDVVETEDVVCPKLIFTENETNFERLYGGNNRSFAKDAFHDHIIPSHRPISDQPKLKGVCKAQDSKKKESREDSDQEEEPHVPRQYVNPEKKGTKAGAHYVFKDVPPYGGCAVVRLKLTNKSLAEDPSIADEEKFDSKLDERRQDADEFYSRLNPGGNTGSGLSEDLRNIMRQALAGMLWNKQFYHFVQRDWINGDPGQPPPPPERKWVRNIDWKHLHIEDILSMPDKWEYPFFAAWDTAFHCIPLAMVDPTFAKNQLDIMTREWYMKPDGSLPAYEWNFSDVNPPVHAWATFRVFKIERKMYGREDLQFLERVFQKLLLNFTWWVNRKDASGQNVFEGGFLGLDNIGLFNRSEPLPTGGSLRQADGTAWMAFFALNMLNMALELAKHNQVYEDIASKFFEHFLFISEAMTFGNPHDEQSSLWNDEDGFYYDAISWGNGNSQQLPVRSLVGLIPLYATLTLEPGVLKRFPGFKKRMDWFTENRPEFVTKNIIANMTGVGKHERKLLALANEVRLKRILEKMLDETEFLSEYGIRSLSLYHKDNPYKMEVNGQIFSVDYWPGDSKSGMFGGNSNWRGPIWLATTFLLIESLQRFYQQYHGTSLVVECPKGSGEMMNLAAVADEIQHRIIHLFAKDPDGRRACNGGIDILDKDPFFKDNVFFHEFFHADSGQGLGASHQTGWTGLVAWMIFQSGSTARLPRTPRTPRSSADHYFAESVPPTPAESVSSTDNGGHRGTVNSGFGGFPPPSVSELSPDEVSTFFCFILLEHLT
ncbi:Six-hairpin glycosidase-like protein [Phakopsora pachyrhizi]|uniref:Six-hairpin glycosidase-like protein n=1 Tax=Phakopsora pachyrhizi TaxID=170000 RepID=A0AAV0BI46_PHAPC|nr:Six-hairpin glycosidase-like protein [Phakopsora pachyrhizi]